MNWNNLPACGEAVSLRHYQKWNLLTLCRRDGHEFSWTWDDGWRSQMMLRCVLLIQAMDRRHPLTSEDRRRLIKHLYLRRRGK